MVVALLLLIVVILLFGAAAVRGWLTNLLAWGVGLVALLVAVGFVKSRYDNWHAASDHASLVEEAKNATLKTVAESINKPKSSLVDVVTYDTEGSFFMCGTIAGTSGYGGTAGRQRFLSNGGGITEIERPKDKANFDGRQSLRCTMNPTAALLSEE